MEKVQRAKTQKQGSHVHLPAARVREEEAAEEEEQEEEEERVGESRSKNRQTTTAAGGKVSESQLKAVKGPGGDANG